MVEDVHGHEGDVGFVGKVVMHPLTHWVIDSGCTSHMTPRADFLDEKSKAEVTFGPTSCRAKLGKKVLWSLEEETSCIKDLPKWHWMRRLLDKEVRLEIVKTHQQAADIFTKRLAEADHWKGMKLAGMSVH
ncbi:hypothetical protein CLOP_g10345 [Closterium sp. NIES-67]|nr:hypothetical protein CLOP_g10345 [Closterium sp. NIES-67]